MKKLIAYIFIITTLLLTGCNTQNTSSYTNNATQTSNTITQDKAKQIALEHANIKESDVQQLKINKQTSNNIEAYYIEFKTKDKIYKYDINLTTGEILNSFYTTNIGLDDSNPAQTNNNGSSQTNSEQITAQKAKEIALAHANIKEADTQLLKVKEDYENEIAVYEVTFYSKNKEYDYDIEKATGKILQYDYDIEDVQSNPSNSNQKQITLEQAKNLALAKVPGATSQNIHIKQDYDNGRMVYEGEIYYNHIEYEFEIEGSTGNFLEWSVD